MPCPPSGWPGQKMRRNTDFFTGLVTIVTNCPQIHPELCGNKRKEIMNHEISAQWMGKMQFNALVNGHTVVMDGPERVGGEDAGPIPKPLVLTALSGCTGMDVVAMLRKNQQEVRDFVLNVRGELSKGHPLQYVAVHLDYIFDGPPEYADAALQAVTLSQEKYCGVSDMLKKIMPVTWTVTYNKKIVYSNEVNNMEPATN